MPRLHFSSPNIVKVLSLDKRPADVASLIESMPDRFYAAILPLPEADATIEVWPKRAEAYAIIAREKGWLIIISTWRIRVRISTKNTHGFMIARLVEKNMLTTTLGLMTSLRG